MDTPSRTRSIDEEWRAAEERLGEWWGIRSLTRLVDGWEAVAAEQGNQRIKVGHGTSVADALADLS